MLIELQRRNDIPLNALTVLFLLGAIDKGTALDTIIKAMEAG